jgi:hypothetical protein
VADYAQLSDNTKKLKRAAIDAWMKQEGWDIEGNKYHGPHGAAYEVTRPGEDGEGGGDWSGEFFQEWFVGGDKDQEFSSRFDEIRSNIDTALKPWQPDAIATPSEFDPLIDSMRDANTKLALSSNASGGSVNAGGSIAGNIRGLDTESAKLSGSTIDTFRSKFVLQLDRVVGGEHALTVVLGGAIAAEKTLWENAKQTVADTVETATNSFRAYADGNDAPDWGLILKVVGVAVEGVAAFATNGATVALSAGTGIKLLQAGQEASEKKAKEPKSRDYDGIWNAFTQAVEDLDAAITSEEKALATNLQDNYAYVTGLKGTPESFDLNPAILDISDDSQAEIHIIQSVVDAITETYMPAIANSLTSAAADVDGAGSSLPWIRDESVGYTNYGPWSELYTLLWLLYTLLTDLSWEVTSGARTLALVVEDIGVTDTEAQDALEKHHEKVREGSGYDPFPPPADSGDRGNRPN